MRMEMGPENEGQDTIEQRDGMGEVETLETTANPTTLKKAVAFFDNWRREEGTEIHMISVEGLEKGRGADIPKSTAELEEAFEKLSKEGGVIMRAVDSKEREDI